MDLILIKKGNYTDISLLKGILENNQIKTLVKAEKGEGFVMRAGNLLEEYSLYVHPDDETTARELAEIYAE
ncbi:MAG: hypothetical protein GX217_03900 [Clostridiaceae bacterium]|nr:hypothetical protein [Clostridiaceae bacterium]